MYKDLNRSLKEFYPTDTELTNLSDRFMNHEFIHKGDNIFGEMYEAWVYEYLKSWAIANPEVSQFVIKKSFSNREYSNGLNYDKNGQIIYYQNGKKAAEYDGLFIYKDKIVFVESSVSELRSYYRRLEDKLVTKRQLLVDLFKTDEVYYLVVTRPKKRSLAYRSLPYLVLYKLKDPDFTVMVKNDRVLFKPNPKLVDLESISFSSSFSS